MIVKCPHCGANLTKAELAKLWNSLICHYTSKKKAKSSAKNGKLGGRPKKNKK